MPWPLKWINEIRAVHLALTGFAWKLEYLLYSQAFLILVMKTKQTGYGLLAMYNVNKLNQLIVKKAC